MRHLALPLASLCLAAALSACGGGGAGIGNATSTSSASNVSTDPVLTSTSIPTATLTYTLPLKGISFRLNDGDSVHVPPGSSIEGDNGTVLLAGNNAVLHVNANALVTVPANATVTTIGTAANLVTTAPAPVGALTLNVPVVIELAGSAKSTAPVSDGVGADVVLAGNGQMAADLKGNVYTSDNGTLKSVSVDGEVTTLVDTFSPYDWSALATDSAGNVYGQGISASSPASASALSVQRRSPDGLIELVAENWTSTATPGPDWGTTGIAVSNLGVLYAIDPLNHAVVRFNANGTVQRIAGNGVAGFKDGLGSLSSFNNPTSLALDANRNVYVADTGNHAIRKISPVGEITTLALTGNPGPIAVDPAGRIYCLASAPATMVRIDPATNSLASKTLPNISGTVTGITVSAIGTVYISARTAAGGALIYLVGF